MSRSVGGRLSIVFAAVYIVSFGLFVALALQAFSASGVDQRYFVSWIMSTAFLGWFDRIIVLTMLVFLLTFSFIVPRNEQPKVPSAVIRLMQRMVMIILLLTIVFAVVQYAVYPKVVRARSAYLRQTQRAEALMESANAYELQGEYALAILALQDYLQIWKTDDDAARMLVRLQRQQLVSDSQNDDGDTIDPRSMVQLQEQQAGDLLQQAQDLFSQEDWFGAYYFARLAQQMDGSRSDIALFLAQVEQTIGPESRIETQSLSSDEQRQQYLLRSKRSAVNALMSSDPVRAYYILLRLKKEFPTDPDVKKYLPIAVNGDEELGIPGVRDLTYFIPEAQEMLTLPGFDELLVVHQWDQSRKEIVSIGKMVYGHSAVYFRDIEVIAMDEEGQVIRHLYSPFGKLISDEQAPIIISLHGIHPGFENVVLDPEYYVVDEAEQYQEIPLLRLRIGVQGLETFDQEADWNSADPMTLYRAARIMPGFGFDSLVPNVRFLLSLLGPFAFFLASFFALGTGIRLHSRYSKMLPVFLWPAILLIPFLLLYILRAYEYFMRVILAAGVGAWGFAGGLALLLVLQAGLFGGVLFFASRELIVRE